MPDDPRLYMDFTGTGNSLNPVQPSVLRLIMDSLRYWVIECHVDGFRFDLASALAREFYDVDRLSAFFDVIHQDPVLSQVKLIAEPWDVGPGGYQVGNFPVLWSEWNGIYRDTIRDFWRGEASVADFASRFTGSSDLYQSDGRQPFASINFVTAHDGFTLRDLVSYDEKHNEANQRGQPRRHRRQPLLELRRRGRRPTTPRSTRCASRQQRNFLATLLLSQGVPMLLGGDEFGRTQEGNNNAWCQDNGISWYDWEHDEAQQRTARVHAPADRPAARAPGVPAHALPRRPPARRLRTARRVVVPPRRPAHDPARLAARRRPHARRVPQRRRAAGDHGRRRADRRRLVPAPLQRRTSRTSSFRLPNHAFGSEWALELSTADPEPGGRDALRRPRSRARHGPLGRAPAARGARARTTGAA